jgi:drug/metabolite transporter (DMT)-like permease
VALLEPVLGPIWVWLAFAERPGDLGLIGAALVIAAILFNALMAMRRREAGTVAATP